MLIAMSDCTVLNIDKFKSLMIKYTPEKERIKISEGWLGLFPVWKTTEKDSWTLNLNYRMPNDPLTDWTFTCTSNDKNELQERAREIITQIKQYDPAAINAAFEEAFFKEP